MESIYWASLSRRFARRCRALQLFAEVARLTGTAELREAVDLALPALRRIVAETARLAREEASKEAADSGGFIHADCDGCGAPGIMRPGDTPYCGPCWSVRVAQEATDTAEEPPFSEQEAAAGVYDGGEYDPVHARHVRLNLAGSLGH